MATSQVDLEGVRSKILGRVASLAQAGDVAALARWSQLAQECDALALDQDRLHQRIRAFVSSLEQTAAQPTPAPAPPTAIPTVRRASPKKEGAIVRSEWLHRLASTGVRLLGHGKRFSTSSGQAVSIGFANELPGLPNKWFLGTADEPTEVVVLLCRDAQLRVHDFVIPVASLGGRWHVLARSNGQVKFNVRREAHRFLLLIPGNEPVDITSYFGGYDALRGAA